MLCICIVCKLRCLFSAFVEVEYNGQLPIPECVLQFLAIDVDFLWSSLFFASLQAVLRWFCRLFQITDMFPWISIFSLPEFHQFCWPCLYLLMKSSRVAGIFSWCNFLCSLWDRLFSFCLHRIVGVEHNEVWIVLIGSSVWVDWNEEQWRAKAK